MSRTHRRPSRRPIAAAVDALENRRLLAHTVGMVVADNNAANVDRNAAVMKEMGVTSIRLWATVADWKNDRYLTNSMKRAIDYANKGFDVMLIVHTYQGHIPDPVQVKDWFHWATSNKALREAVNRWQIGNETDHEYYWKGTPKQYVTQFLKPASEALRAAGEKVVSAGPSWNPEDVREFIDLGLLGYVDYIGYHPYANSVSVQAKRIREVNAIVAGRKPIIASEWNVYENTGTERGWAESVGRSYPYIENGFEMAYYFNLTSGHPSMAGPAGTITPTGKKTSFFYAIQTAVNDGKKVPAPTPTPTPTPTNPTPTPAPTPKPTPKPPPPEFEPETGNVPTTPAPAKPATPSKPTTTPKPSTSKPTTPVVTPPKPVVPPPPPDPAITSFALYNADTDRVIPGYEAVISGARLNLADVGTRNIAIVANTVGSKSVFFNVNGEYAMDSAAPFASFGDRGTNLLGKRLDPGVYTVTATAYAARGGSGKSSAEKTATITVINRSGNVAAGREPTVLGLQVQDARTGLAIPGLENLTASTAIRLSKLTSRAIRVVALTSNGTGSVELASFGRIEALGEKPFAGGSFYARSGKYYLQATAYAAGIKGNTLGLTIRFI